MPDSQTPDARLMMLVFFCRLCLQDAFVLLVKKTNVVGRLRLPTEKA